MSPTSSSTFSKREELVETFSATEMLRAKFLFEIRGCLLQKYLRAVRRPPNNLNYVRMTQTCLEDTYLATQRGPEELRRLLLGRVLAVNIRKMMLV